MQLRPSHVATVGKCCVMCTTHIIDNQTLTITENDNRVENEIEDKTEPLEVTLTTKKAQALLA